MSGTSCSSAVSSRAGSCPPDPAIAQASAPARWWMLALVCTALVLSMTTWFSATAVTPQIVAAFAMSETAAAWLTSAVQLGFVVGALGLTVSGLADRLPARPLMAGAALAAMAANLCLLWVTETPGVLLARAATGAALAGIYPPALKLVATWFRHGRGMAMGAAIGALTLGSALPHLVRAIGVGLEWRYVVSAASILTLVGALLIGLLLREGPFPFVRAPFALREIGPVLRDRRLFLVNLGYFGHMWELYAMWAWFLAFAAQAPAIQALGHPAAASLITFLAIASGSIGCVLGGFLADRIGRSVTTAALMAASGGCALVIGFAFAGPLWLLLLITAIWGITIIGDSAQFSALVTEIGDPRFVGTALALQLGIGFALTIVVIQALPIVAGIVGWQWVFLMLVPGPVFGVLAMARVRQSAEASRAIRHGDSHKADAG